VGANLQCGIGGLSGGGGQATSVVTTNTRVRTPQGYVMLVSDLVQLSPPAIYGMWIVPAMRCRVGGVPVINASSTGIAYVTSPGGPTPGGPLQLSSTDQHVSCQ